ncbi:MAG TPA: D-alanine--D-alanine ligase family protein [Egibacteraceae bacterium]|nr:D-alanine--D-alanine ligase [Actinomycetota bacterium]HWB71821.1 D-alanine--D-alanine ligase family protein [Egibacteraceae bacterium]
MSAGGRTRVLLLFGGRSSEHEVSCLSARSVLAAMDPERFVVTAVGITREGRWTLVDGVPEGSVGALPRVPDDGDTVALVQTRKGPRLVRYVDGFDAAAAAVSATAGLRGDELGPVDVCFPVLHGPYGEDGTMQGLLASLGVPYVGADVASSAVAIDKQQMKTVFAARGLPLVPHMAVRRQRWDADSAAVIEEIGAALRYPLFTKPVRQGSSIGIRRCAGREELVAGIEEAFGYDRVAIVEQGVERARELECGVLGNAQIEVTQPGEVITAHEFYDFEAKYLDEVDLRCPADVSAEVADACKDYARQAYLAIGARGMARVDFFYAEASGQLLVNEINTIPGFTSASMFPHLWACEGVDYPTLIGRLLELAFEAARVDGHYAP